MWSKVLIAASLAGAASACSGCSGTGDVEFVRNVRLIQPRQQPDAKDAVTGPKAPLEWGQINFLATTDTHGWLEGHVKEQNYGADWGDWVSFVRHMRYKADSLGVDLFVVDSGDLHDGAGLSDATANLPGGVNGEVSNPIFENLDYDLLSIGNHELYVSEIAYEHFNQFAHFYRDRYLTSNVQIYDPKSATWKYIGRTNKYFKTNHGLNIQSYGVLYDFTGNSNVSRVQKAADMVKEQWFIDSLNEKNIDLFVVVGHNPVRGSSSTFPIIQNAIKAVHPSANILYFGGHTHIRDFKVYDNSSVGIEAGRYCETFGWLAASGIKGGKSPKGVPNPTRPAINGTTSTLSFARRYLDWNRLTMKYHADNVKTFDTTRGQAVTANITAERKALNLTNLYGCAPQTYCLSCAPATSDASIYPLVQKALAATVINPDRATTPRIILVNSGGFRFDLVQGPFTYDDAFIVAPFTDQFYYIKDVPYAAASQVLGILNKGAFQKRASKFIPRGPSSLYTRTPEADACPLDGSNVADLTRKSTGLTKRRTITRRQQTVTPGYVTKDDFGTDGDDTPHSPIPFYSAPNDIQAQAAFPTDETNPATVDVVFYDFIESNVLAALKQAGATYTAADVSNYLPASFTSNSFLPAYAQLAWNKDCAAELANL